MIGCQRTRVRKQPIIVLYFESETVFKFYNLEARTMDAGVKHVYLFLNTVLVIYQTNQQSRHLCVSLTSHLGLHCISK